MTDHILAGAVLAAMAAIAAFDARRAIVDPRLVLALLAAAAAWRFLGAGHRPRYRGIAVGRCADGRRLRRGGGHDSDRRRRVAPSTLAALSGRRHDAGRFRLPARSPRPGLDDAVGMPFALLHRIWLQHRRGRPIRQGLVPLGPGMTAGAAVVFLCIHTGVALAAEKGLVESRRRRCRKRRSSRLHQRCFRRQ